MLDRLKYFKSNLKRKPAIYRWFLPKSPISRAFGYDRGKPIDRYFIERFLRRNSNLIRGKVLEVGDNAYTRNFGSDVEQSDILHYEQQADREVIHGDLVKPETIPKDRYDCFVCTQTFQFLSNVPQAVRSAHQLLVSGGAFLGTMPAISQKSVGAEESWHEYWRFTSASVRKEFGEVFGDENVEVHAIGNVYLAVNILMGLSVEEIPKDMLEQHDPNYECLITVMAKKR